MDPRNQKLLYAPVHGDCSDKKHHASTFRIRKMLFPVTGAAAAAESSFAGRRSTRKVNGDLPPATRLGLRRQATRRYAGHNAQGASPMFKTTAVPVIFIACAVLPVLPPARRSNSQCRSHASARARGTTMA